MNVGAINGRKERGVSLQKTPYAQVRCGRYIKDEIWDYKTEHVPSSATPSITSASPMFNTTLQVCFFRSSVGSSMRKFIISYCRLRRTNEQRERGGKYSDHIWNAPGLVMQKTERKSFTNKRKDGNGSRRNKKSAQTQDTWRKSVHYSLQQKETESLHEFDFKSVWDEILGARLRMFAQT